MANEIFQKRGEAVDNIQTRLVKLGKLKRAASGEFLAMFRLLAETGDPEAIPPLIKWLEENLPPLSESEITELERQAKED